MLTTADYLFTATIYVGFRSLNPSPLTWLKVLAKMLQLRIDISDLAKWGTAPCV